MTKEDLLSWLEGQRSANRRHGDEVRAMTPGEKLDRISRLMSSARMFDMSRRNAGDERVIALWQRLRERWPGRG
jgi:hypothetical protein